MQNDDQNTQIPFHFTVVISSILHFIILLSPPSIFSQFINVQPPSVGINRSNESKLKIIRKAIGSEQRKSQFNPVLSFEKFESKIENNNINIKAQNIPSSMTLHRSKRDNERLPSILTHTVQGRDVPLPSGLAFNHNKQGFLDGTDFNIGVELPKGVEENQLNRVEEVLYSFRKRTFEQFINRLFYVINTQRNIYPPQYFPWTNKRQVVRTRLIFNNDGYVEKIIPLQKSDSVKLQNFFESIVAGMTTIPNPPQIALDENGKLSLIISIIID